MAPEKPPDPKPHRTNAGKSLADESAMKKCVMCRKEIPTGARICTECDCYQDWRQYFGLSSTVLSLLVALFSVLTVAVPIIYAALAPKISAVHCNLISWDENTAEVKIAVSNEGARPAVIKTLVLEPKTSKTSASTMAFQSDFLEPILEPGKFRTLPLHGVIGTVRANRLEPLNSLRSKYDLKLKIFPFASESSEVQCENWDKFQ
jgi:hypothetical protein